MQQNLICAIFSSTVAVPQLVNPPFFSRSKETSREFNALQPQPLAATNVRSVTDMILPEIETRFPVRSMRP